MFEYLVVDNGFIHTNDLQIAANKLNDLGREGWELKATIGDRIVFQRFSREYMNSIKTDSEKTLTELTEEILNLGEDSGE